MRAVLSVVILLLVASPLCAEQGRPRPAATGVSAHEIGQGFVSLFDGRTLNGWQGATSGYVAHKGVLVCEKHGGGNLFTTKQYRNFIFRVEYRLEPGGNNGIGIRAPLKGEPGFEAMEIQILDDSFPEYQKLIPVQFNGSIYGVVAAKRGHLKKVGEWNTMEVAADGPHIRVTLNGTRIVDADVSKVGPKRIHGHDLNGLGRETGYLALCGHGHHVEFRNLRVKELP